MDEMTGRRLLHIKGQVRSLDATHKEYDQFSLTLLSLSSTFASSIFICCGSFSSEVRPLYFSLLQWLMRGSEIGTRFLVNRYVIVLAAVAASVRVGTEKFGGSDARRFLLVAYFFISLAFLDRRDGVGFGDAKEMKVCL